VNSVILGELWWSEIGNFENMYPFLWALIQILGPYLLNLNDLPQLTGTSQRTKKYLMKMRIWLSLGPWLTIDMFFILINWEVGVKIEISDTPDFHRFCCVFGGTWGHHRWLLSCFYMYSTVYFFHNIIWVTPIPTIYSIWSPPGIYVPRPRIYLYSTCYEGNY